MCDYQLSGTARLHLAHVTCRFLKLKSNICWLAVARVVVKSPLSRRWPQLNEATPRNRLSLLHRTCGLSKRQKEQEQGKEKEQGVRHPPAVRRQGRCGPRFSDGFIRLFVRSSIISFAFRLFSFILSSTASWTRVSGLDCSLTMGTWRRQHRHISFFFSLLVPSCSISL